MEKEKQGTDCVNSYKELRNNHGHISDLFTALM
jgi:hypothetical protein